MFIDAFAGATGGVLAALLFYPLENLRTRLQAGKETKETKEGEESKADQKKLTSMQLLRQIIKTEGL